MQVLLGLGEGGPLAPSTEYFYMVGEGDNAQSEALSFTTPPPTGPDSLPYRCATLPYPNSATRTCFYAAADWARQPALTARRRRGQRARTGRSGRFAFFVVVRLVVPDFCGLGARAFCCQKIDISF